VARIRSEGPKITIVFQSAEGLEAGKTKIDYRGVDIGTITAIRLTEDHERGRRWTGRRRQWSCRPFRVSSR
jgi:paraquat-inducible protein B